MVSHTAGVLDLYWIPLGAGAQVVRLSGRIYETGLATLQRRPRRDLYHSALVATIDGAVNTVEVAPVPDGAAASLPAGGRAPGWSAGQRVALRSPRPPRPGS